MPLTLTLALPLTLALTLPLALAALAAAVFAKAHRTEVVLAAASGWPPTSAELAATGTGTAGMPLRAAVTATSVVQGLDGEFGKGAGDRDGAFQLGEGRSY